MHRARELAAGVEADDRFLVEKVVVRIAVHQRADADHDQAFLAISHEHPRVDEADGLLFILRQPLPQRIDSQRARQRDARGVFGADISSLTQRRNWRAHDAFRETFLINVRHVEDLEPIRPVRRVEVFAAQREIENLLRMMMMRLLQHALLLLDVLLEIVRVSQPMQVAAQRRLRLLLLRPDHRFQPTLARADIGMATEEIHRPGTESEQLRHPRIVVIVLRRVTIRAVFRRAFAARSVREVRVERLAAVTLGAHRLLLRIDPLAIAILRTDNHGG